MRNKIRLVASISLLAHSSHLVEIRAGLLFYGKLSFESNISDWDSRCIVQAPDASLDDDCGASLRRVCGVMAWNVSAGL